MRLALITLLTVLPLAASAQIYRWVDADGVVHFSQTPPDHGSYQKISPMPPPPTSAPGVAALRESAQNLDRSEVQAKQARQQMLQAKADQAERCAKARERISFLEEKTAHRLFVTGPDGQPARMTDEQYEQALADARAAAAKYCP
jgi:hypothetical protein